MANELMKSQTDRMISGVCGGLAEYMQTETAFIRIGFLVALFFFGTGIIIYIIFMIAIPSVDRINTSQHPPSNCKNLNMNQCQFWSSQGSSYCRGCGSPMNYLK